MASGKISPSNLLRHELMGLDVEVLESSNSSQKGLKGKVTNETRQTLTIDTDRGEKIIAKDQCIFLFTLPGGERVRVDGSLLVARPEDRVKKRLKRW